MGLTYSFTFGADASVMAAELECFLKSVEADAKHMGFDPTLVFRATNIQTVPGVTEVAVPSATENRAF